MIMEKDLKQYNLKRNFKKTKEPVGKVKSSTKKLRFVVQHHLARKDHYDFRLEWNGTLKSWAIPKGPSYNPKDKRLAVHVEDHPLNYRHFEGTIPKGQYGGGTVMIWDEGYWEPFENPDLGFQNGSLKFRLKGKRLHGKWTLVHFKEDNWLLIKENDSFLHFSNIHDYATSIKTGRTMEEIQNGMKNIRTITSKKDGIVENILITHPDKVIFKRPKVTKLDVAMYYQKVAPRMLPFLEHRIISTIRLPEGANGERFFKKHLENGHPGIGKIKISNDNHKKEDYYYIKSVEGLISEVQRNSFEFHTWGSRVSQINHPDILVFDLDPDEKMSLKKVREGVMDLKGILDDLSLTSFLKTSGGKGYHVVVPIRSFKNWKEFREFAQNIAKLMEEKWKDKYTSNIRKERRKGKIFIDWIRNTKGATSVAPYSVRIRKKATVSMPIFWKELNSIKPDGITIKNAVNRLRKKDPWNDFFDVDQ